MEVLNDGAPAHSVARFQSFVEQSGLRAEYGEGWLTVSWIPSLGLASALIDGKGIVAAASPEELFAAVLRVLYPATEP